ncbi:MAG: hypothetical protein JSW10_13245 [Pseudomonadota bacterium]|nr:MAG: hypothetical protein JSW10_13245 [Pseudomonadota bacterium]
MKSELFTVVIGALVISGAWLPDTAQAQRCQATPRMTPGTHYKPVETQRTNVGQGLLIKGRILSALDCQPVPGARIAHWQANSNGVYVDALRAWMLSDVKGGYRFNTEWPAAAIPHIHFIVSADGFETLSTQWVGDGTVEEITFNIVLRPAPGHARQ